MTKASSVESSRVRSYGVLGEVSPRLLSIGAVWVLFADAVFTAMALHAGGVPLFFCLVGACLLSVLLVMLSGSLLPVAVASLASALIFGNLILTISHLMGFAVLIALEIGVMHFCALSIIARLKVDVRSYLSAHPGNPDLHATKSKASDD